MNINFEMAIKFIDLGSYDEAVNYLKKSIDEEKAGGNEGIAIEYTCVLGELLSNLGDEIKAKEEFDKVLEYCDKTNSLDKQKQIASDFIKGFELRNKPNSTQETAFKQ